MSLSFFRASSSLYFVLQSQQSHQLHTLPLCNTCLSHGTTRQLTRSSSLPLFRCPKMMVCHKGCPKMISFGGNIWQVLIAFVSLQPQRLSITLALFVFNWTQCFVASYIMMLSNVTMLSQRLLATFLTLTSVAERVEQLKLPELLKVERRNQRSEQKASLLSDPQSSVKNWSTFGAWLKFVANVEISSGTVNAFITLQSFTSSDDAVRFNSLMTCPRVSATDSRFLHFATSWYFHWSEDFSTEYCPKPSQKRKHLKFRLNFDLTLCWISPFSIEALWKQRRGPDRTCIVAKFGHCFCLIWLKCEGTVVKRAHFSKVALQSERVFVDYFVRLVIRRTNVLDTDPCNVMYAVIFSSSSSFIFACVFIQVT